MRESVAHRDDLLRFVRERVQSVWGLELLLLVRRSNRTWTVEDLVAELRASTWLVNEALARFEALGLVSQAEFGFSYAAPAGLDAVCAELERLYRERPVTVINAIASPPNKLQSLADAFRVRK